MVLAMLMSYMTTLPLVIRSCIWDVQISKSHILNLSYQFHTVNAVSHPEHHGLKCWHLSQWLYW